MPEALVEDEHIGHVGYSLKRMNTRMLSTIMMVVIGDATTIAYTYERILALYFFLLLI